MRKIHGSPLAAATEAVAKVGSTKLRQLTPEGLNSPLNCQTNSFQSQAFNNEGEEDGTWGCSLLWSDTSRPSGFSKGRCLWGYTVI